MKNWSVALSGSDVRAMATVPRALRRPFFASFTIAGPFARSSISGVRLPPWIMKLGITRWNTVPS